MSNNGDIYLTMRELMNLMIILGYPVTSKGLCYGYNYSAQMAMLLRDANAFNQRSIKLAELYKTLADLAKKTLLEIYDPYPPPQLESHPDDFLGVLIEMLSKNRFARDQTIFNKLTELKTNLIEEFTNYVKITFVNEQTVAVQSQAYFDSVAVLQDSSSLFPSNYRTSNQQNARMVMGLLLPVNLEKQGKTIHHANPIAGIFDRVTLKEALVLIAKQIPPMDSTISFEFSGYLKVPGSGWNAKEELAQHAIAVGFDPSKQEWLFADSAEHQIKHFPLGKEDNLADEILEEFCFKKKLEDGVVRPFYINPLLTDATAVEPFNQAVTSMQNSQTWQQLQKASNNEESFLANEQFLIKSGPFKSEVQHLSSIESHNGIPQ